MRDEADGVWPERIRQHAASLEPRHETGRALPCLQSENDDVGFYRSGVDRHALGVRECFGQEARVGVIFVEMLWAFFERDEACRGEDSNLPHAAA